MNYFLREFLDRLLYGNIIIATACLFFSLEFFFLAEIESAMPYLRFCFYGTLAHYGFHRLYNIRINNSEKDSPRNQKIAKYRVIILVLSLVGLFVSLKILLFEFKSSYFDFVFPVVIAVFYSVPIFRKRLRDIAYLKVVLVALVWAYLSSFLPANLYGFSNIWLISFVFLEHFLYIFTITLAFDHRDNDSDRTLGVKTFANQLSFDQLKTMMIIGLILLQLVSFSGYLFGFYSEQLTLAFFLFYILLYFILIVRFSKEAKDYYYLFLVDGTIILHGLLVFFLN